MSMISGFFSPWDPLFIDFNTPNYFNEYKKTMEPFRKNNILANFRIWEIQNVDMFYQIWKRQSPNNDEDPSKKFLKSLDMEPIST